jgi:hypothetical protein
MSPLAIGSQITHMSDKLFPTSGLLQLIVGFLKWKPTENPKKYHLKQMTIFYASQPEYLFLYKTRVSSAEKLCHVHDV